MINHIIKHSINILSSIILIILINILSSIILSYIYYRITLYIYILEYCTKRYTRTLLNIAPHAEYTNQTEYVHTRN